MSDAPQTVVETKAYLRAAEALFNGDERAAIVAYIGSNPESGEVMPDTRGVRKLRWGIEGRGKRGGVRVIYYFYSESIPVFLLSMFAKNQKANLTKAERNALGNSRLNLQCMEDQHEKANARSANY